VFGKSISLITSISSSAAVELWGGLPHGRLNQLGSSIRPLHVEHAILLVGKLVVIDKKIFQFSQEMLAQIADIFNPRQL